METSTRTVARIPRYILSQKCFYNSIAENFYTTTSQAHTKEEYEKALKTVCNKWRGELTDSDVLNYFFIEGIMEIETINEIKQYFIDNAGEFQKTILNANLKQGNKYTLVYMSEFGFPIADKITFDNITPVQYAQYEDAILMTF